MSAPEIRDIRAALTADPDVGAGNVLAKVIEHGADPDGPGHHLRRRRGRAPRLGRR